VYSTSGGAGTGAVSSILLPSDAYAIPGGKKTSLRPGDLPLKGQPPLMPASSMYGSG